MQRISFTNQIKDELLNLSWTDLEKQIILFAICKIKDVLVNSDEINVKLFKHPKIITLLESQSFNNNYEIIPLKVHYFIKIKSKNWINDYNEFFNNKLEKYLNNQKLIRLLFVGYFLSTGWISNLGVKNYQLEIRIKNKNYVNKIINQAKQFNINFKYQKKSNGDVIYIKKTDYISDFLKLILATKSLIDFEDDRILKNIQSFLKRSEAIENYNFQRISQLSVKHLSAINKLKLNNQYQNLKKELYLISELRLQYPETSLNDLCYLYNQKYKENLSKITIFNWINNVIDIANKKDEK